MFVGSFNRDNMGGKKMTFTKDDLQLIKVALSILQHNNPMNIIKDSEIGKLFSKVERELSKDE